MILLPVAKYGVDLPSISIPLRSADRVGCIRRVLMDNVAACCYDDMMRHFQFEKYGNVSWTSVCVVVFLLEFSRMTNGRRWLRKRQAHCFDIFAA